MKAIAAANRENPIAERVNGILKEELLRPGYPDHASAKMAITKAIHIYNKKRPHRSLNMMMPEQAHQMSGPIPKRWKKTTGPTFGTERKPASEEKPNTNLKKVQPVKRKKHHHS